jgi:hypothetical protein
MREITKSISVSVDGKLMDFRLTKLDAFSGASLLRMLSNMPQVSSGDSVMGFITHLSESDLRSLMITCLQHCEMLLPAGWMPVMTRGKWTVSELEHDTAVCLKLTIEEVLWTLEGFFDGGGSTSLPEAPDS